MRSCSPSSSWWSCWPCGRRACCAGAEPWRWSKPRARRPAPAESWSLIDTFQAHPALWLLALFLLILPAFASNFVLIEMFGWAMILGMIALSLMFLAGYGGMVSLVQMTVAGCAGYMVAIFGTSAVTDISLGWPWWLGVPVAILIAVIFGTLSGVLAVRTEGIYTIMITLAIASAFYYFTLQNYTIFNGFSGFNAVRTPQVVRRRLARAGAVLLPDPVLGGRCPIWSWSTSRARRSGSRCRASATMRGAWRRSASTSRRIASPPTPSRR